MAKGGASYKSIGLGYKSWSLGSVKIGAQVNTLAQDPERLHFTNEEEP